MKKLYPFIAALLFLPVFAGERPVSSAEMLEMQISSQPLLTLPTTNWRCIYADKEVFANIRLRDAILSC